MLRGGGVCVEGPAGSLPRVSPRIRALQDRLLDSLPADGAWECLSPAQREAIISLHRARLTRSIINQNDYRDEAKRQNRKSNAKGLTKGLHRYGRSRSYEDKLESETDDSGVRVASGGTNSSTSNSHNSHEDDSSDPGVKRGGRFTKSPGASRLTRKEQKCSTDVNKAKNVTNGVGNVNKIISKQLHRTGQQCSSNVTLDCRNVIGDKRTRIDNNGAIFESRQNQFEVKYRRFTTGDKVIGKFDGGISRKNILQRYQDSGPLISKETTSSEDDSGVNFQIDKYDKNFIDSSKPRRPSSGVDYDFEFESDQTPRSDSTPSPCGPNVNGIRVKGEHHKIIARGMMKEDVWERNVLTSKVKNEGDVEYKKEDGKRNLKVEYRANLNSNFDYRNQLNQEGINKYSSNWNSIVLCRALPVKSHNIPSAKTNPLQNPLFKTSAAPHGRSVGNLAYADRYNKSDNRFSDATKYDMTAYQDKGQGKKYIRSKSLDRKYLEDTSDDDESDFEIRRRTDRMRRYAKANQEWEVHNKYLIEKNQQFLRRNPCIGSEVKTKSKSSWDIARKVDKEEENGDNNGFRSRSNIINRWKSEENELSKNIGHSDKKDLSRRDFDKYKWRRRSCDFELEFSDNDKGGKRFATSPMDEFNRKQWQRRSCDFEMEFDDSDSLKRSFYDDDWDDSVDNEIKLLQKRTQFSPKTELRKIYPVPPPREKKESRKYLKEEIGHLEEQKSKEMVILENAKKYQIRPEISGRKWARIEDEHHVTPFHHPGVNRMEKEKGKSPHAFRGKLRLFKSILPF